MIGIDKRDHDQWNHQIDQFEVALQDQRKGAGKVGGQLLVDFSLIGEEVGHAADDVAEHDADQRHQHGILHLNALNEEHEQQRSDHGEDECEDRAHP